MITFNKKILFIGAIPNEKPDSIGGATILMNSLLNFFNENSIQYIHIKTNNFYGRFSNLKNFIYTIVRLLFIKSNKYDIVFLNVSRNGAFLLSPLIYILAITKGKKFIFRVFGGNFHTLFLQKNKIFRKLIMQILMNSSIVYFETKKQLSFFKELGVKSARWLPNLRKADNRISKSKYKKRFVFISQIMVEKGIETIFETSKKLPSDYIIDIYGPIHKSMHSINFNEFNVNYLGVLKPTEVCETLLNYDFLLLPTFYEGEGYPGIIIEAFSVGVPVISTNWNSIPEIVNSSNGILIEPKNVNQLVDVIKGIEEKEYYMLCKGAVESFKLFDEKNVYTEILNDLNSL